MSSIVVREKKPQDKAWITTLMLESWGSEQVVVQTRIFHPEQLPGFLAIMNDERIGLLTYQLDPPNCEIITLNSLQPGMGVGRSLMNSLQKTALSNGCTVLRLFTTNNNMDALRFYQKYGFHLEKLIKDGVAEDRKIKPEIPLKADNGIPICDYLELTMRINL